MFLITIVLQVSLKIQPHLWIRRTVSRRVSTITISHLEYDKEMYKMIL